MTKTLNRPRARTFADDLFDPLTYTRHAKERTRERHLPKYRRLPESATLWDTDHDRGASRWLIDHGSGTVCLVISDIEPGVVVTAYDPRRRSDWW
jgi:hypothetical protein